jgi:hypothetical protein
LCFLKSHLFVGQERLWARAKGSSSAQATSCMPILLEALCDKSCFARKFAWLGKRNATISPVQPKVTALEAECLRG